MPSKFEFNKGKMVPYPSGAIVPDRDLGQRPALECIHLGIEFGGLKAVDDFSLTIGKTEIAGLIGPNGAGKTTAFNVVTGVYAPTNGAVWFEGRKIIENTPHGKMKKLYKGQNASKYSHMIAPPPDKITQMGIARTFQNIRLWKSQTVFENVLIAKHCRCSANLLSATFRLNADEEKRQREECENLLHVLGLEDVRNELATGLPYGLQRRVEIARALATEPKLLLLDEATNGLDPVVRDEVVDILLDFARDENHSILISSHIVSDLEKLCDTIAFLHKGRLLLCEEKDALREEYALWHGTAAQLAALDAQVYGKRVTPYGAEALVRRDALPAGAELTPVSIEELFVLMVKEECTE